MTSSAAPVPAGTALVSELPIKVRDAAIFLGVSPQTVYLWVERKQIPHLRVMGRSVRFLKSELEPFRRIQTGGGKWQDLGNTMEAFFRKEESRFWWMDYRDRAGKRQRESANTDD